MNYELVPDKGFPHVTDFEGERCFIRMNDFPDDHLYTLIVNGQEVASFDDWPESWDRPEGSPSRPGRLRWIWIEHSENT
jgi:hypothetical protein